MCQLNLSPEAVKDIGMVLEKHGFRSFDFVKDKGLYLPAQGKTAPADHAYRHRLGSWAAQMERFYHPAQQFDRSLLNDAGVSDKYLDAYTALWENSARAPMQATNGHNPLHWVAVQHGSRYSIHDIYNGNLVFSIDNHPGHQRTYFRDKELTAQIGGAAGQYSNLLKMIEDGNFAKGFHA